MSARAQEIRQAVRERAALRVVGDKRPNLKPQRRVSPLVVLAIVCVLGTVALVLVERVMLAQSAFELTHLMERVEAADERRSELAFEVARRENPGRIEYYARTKLGMVDPDPASIQYIVADVAPRRADAGGGSLKARMAGSGPASATGAWGDTP